MKAENIEAELAYRINRDLEYFDGKMPEATAIAWRAYLAAILEWQVIGIATHDRLLNKVPEVPNDPVPAILLGRG